MMLVPTLLPAFQSPGLVNLTIETGWGESENEVPSNLAGSLSTGTFATTRPHITIVSFAYTTAEWDIMRAQYIAALPVQHREGRLEMMLYP